MIHVRAIPDTTVPTVEVVSIKGERWTLWVPDPDGQGRVYMVRDNPPGVMPMRAQCEDGICLKYIPGDVLGSSLVWQARMLWLPGMKATP